MRADGFCEQSPNDRVGKLLDGIFRPSVITAPEILRWLRENGWAVRKISGISFIAVMPCIPGVSRRLVLRRKPDYWAATMDYMSASGCQDFLDPKSEDDSPMEWRVRDVLELEVAASFGPESIPINEELLS